MHFWIKREADGFAVWHRMKGTWHCPHETAVILRTAEYLRLPAPDQVGRLRASVHSITLEEINNGLYINMNYGGDRHVPTREVAMREILSLFDGTAPPTVQRTAPQSPEPASTDAILERLTEGRLAIRTIEELVQAMKAKYAPTPDEMQHEERYLDDFLAVLEEILGAGYDLLTGSGLSAHSEAGASLCYIREQLLDLDLAVKSWIFAREHPGSGPKFKRRYYEQLAEKARKRREANLRRWARRDERREGEDATPAAG